MDLNDLKQNQNGRSRRGDTIRELRRMIYPSRGGSGRQPSSNRRNQSRDVPFMTFVQGKYSVGLIISFIHSSSLLLVDTHSGKEKYLRSKR